AVALVADRGVLAVRRGGTRDQVGNRLRPRCRPCGRRRRRGLHGTSPLVETPGRSPASGLLADQPMLERECGVCEVGGDVYYSMTTIAAAPGMGRRERR